MSISLKKGQKIILAKDDGASFRRVLVGLGWDEAEQKPLGGIRGLFGSKPSPIDCDASAILCGENGKTITRDGLGSCVYFGRLSHPSGSIVHQGDNLTGEGDGDDEQIMVDLERVPVNVYRIVIVVNIYDAEKRDQHFGMINNAFIRLVNLSDNVEFCRYDLSENYNNMAGLIVGEIVRESGRWKFNAIGKPVKKASHLMDIVNKYM